MRHADKKGIEKFTLLGHNIGAKIAMAFACKFPERVDGIVSLDTAPRSNADNQKAAEATLRTLHQIKDLNLESKTRKGAMEVIEQAFSQDGGVANLVASNVVYDPTTENKYVKWCINIPALI